MMYGWRNRIGLVVTSSDRTSEGEYFRHTPDGVSVHVARMLLEDGVADAETLERMSADVERCAKLLKTTDVDVIAYSCTTGSLLKGEGFETEIERRIETVAGVPAVATAASIKRALDALDVESLTVATPYIPELNELEVDFLEDSGYEVLDIYGLGCRTDEEICAHHPEMAYRQAREMNREDADAIFISCTGYRTFEIIDRLERDLDKPVITSNQATLWDALRKIDVDYSEIELGTLFRH
ncbi:maleate cis-trans isomerase [Haladaptatus sp. R4]|uniref:maleate cis-trans isomerase family protein n=1 Tax=Haladaptatus sp. R4 TaxID=1679489 RepID=UPI000AA4B57D|nr:maleate cis-trans isomerase [Haladaptatus sp. R4]